MRVLVCGGRDWQDEATLYRVLDKLRSLFVVSVIIEGEAPGADSLAREWARLRSVPIAPFPADWRVYGPRAGNLRNQRMIDEGHPDLVIAFPMPASRGTWDMVAKSRAAGIRTWVYPDAEGQIDAIGEGVFV